MGGLRKYLPRTFPAFLAGGAALAGVPFLSGFFSKDAILAGAFAQRRSLLYGLGLATAVLTAVYVFRLIALVFFGRERLPREHSAGIHESPAVMTAPMAVLAFCSLAAGILGLPSVFGPNADALGRFLESILPGAAAGRPSAGTEILLMLASTLAFLTGILIAHKVYIIRGRVPGEFPPRFPLPYRVISRKYFVDGAVRAFVAAFMRGAGFLYRRFDVRIVDGAINGAAEAAGFAGKRLNLIQSGFIRDYALAFLAGAVLFLGVLLL